MTKTLVVFHSRTGYTRRVANAIARRLDAEVEEVRIVQRLGGWLGYAMCAFEAMMGLTPALRPGRRSLAGIDLIVIGTPVWFWNLSSPMRSWLTSHSLKGRRFAFFCTMGGSGARGVLATMQQLAGGEPVATLALTDADVDRGADAKVEAFVRALARGRQPDAARLQARAAPA
jgi:flavodoxin